MSDITSLENELNQMILSGQAMEGFEKFYADDVVMQENQDAPRIGKDTNRAYEQQFFGNIAEFHGATLGEVSASGNTSFSEWTFDCTFKDGTRMKNDQVAVRTWQDGKIVKERFYYQPNLSQ